jgi:beta-lactamase class D
VGRHFFKLLLVLTFFMQPLCVAHAEDFELAELFQERGVEGTIVISSFDGKNEYIHNINRAKQELSPASTFKIPNTLIVLEEGAISNGKEIIKWDGKDKGWSAWNQDQSLETAFPLSCVWFYQELAGRVGNEKYLSHLKKINYGNQKTGSEVKSFWLDGDLKISAFDQIRFLKKLYSGNLPYKKQHLEFLKKLWW